MSTHNICFHREIRKILRGYPLNSVAMKTYVETLEAPCHEYLQHMFSWRNKKKYLKVITNYSSLTIPPIDVIHNARKDTLMPSVAKERPDHRNQPIP